MLVVQPIHAGHALCGFWCWVVLLHVWLVAGAMVTWAAHLMAGWDVVRGWRDAVRGEQAVSVPPLPAALCRNCVERCCNVMTGSHLSIVH